MSLFNQPNIIIQTENSSTTYQNNFLTLDEVADLYEYFLDNLDWQHDTARIYGKTIITKRKIAWFADSNLNYNYSGTNRVADGMWNNKVLEIKNKLEKETGFTFNSCLLNLYHNGAEGMGWHSDDQNHLQKYSPVAIISLGAERFFKLRDTPIKLPLQGVVRRTVLPIHKVLLEKGSLLVMLGETQKYWQHEIPKMATIKEPRISLTFRSMKIK
jgi:alkylated DNA repair dioxygenase AlkB